MHKKTLINTLLLLSATASLSGCAQIIADLICPGPGSGITCTRDMAKELGDAYSSEELLEKTFREGKTEKGKVPADIDQSFYAQQGLVYWLQKQPQDAAYAKLRQIAFDAHYTSDVGQAGDILAQTGTCTAMNIAAEMVSSPWQGTPTTPPLPAYTHLNHYVQIPPPNRAFIRQTGYRVLNTTEVFSASPTIDRFYHFDKACLQKVRNQLPPPPSGWKAIP
jgi:hypothetical protein